MNEEIMGLHRDNAGVWHMGFDLEYLLTREWVDEDAFDYMLRWTQQTIVARSHDWFIVNRWNWNVTYHGAYAVCNVWGMEK